MTDSSLDSESGTDEEWVPFKDRPEWSDIEPLPQDDGPCPVVAIAYTEKFKAVYDYFRAVLKKNEKSERALKLTAEALQLNAANYTVWQYRREILKALKKDLNAELIYVQDVINLNPKNYQVWHHRKVIVEWINSPGDELKVTADILRSDAKNYHAWQHRQWVMLTFKLFDQEIDYVNQLIDEDIRNNSAWNQRYFVLKQAANFHPNAIESEIKYTINKIKLAPTNESPWSYLRGLLVYCDKGLQEPSAMDVCRSLYDEGCRSPHLLAYLVDVAAEQVTQGVADATVMVKLLCNELAEKHDNIRAAYWRYIENSVVKASPS